MCTAKTTVCSSYVELLTLFVIMGNVASGILKCGRKEGRTDECI